MEKIKISNKTVGAPLLKNTRKTDTTVPKGMQFAQKGITLIALVITIIILLILAGIVLNLTLGEHGIIRMAEKAGKNYVNSAEEEQKKLGDLLNEVDNIINGTGNGNNPVTPPPPTTAVAGGGSHTAKQIQYTWEELNSLAKVISDNYGTGAGQINNDTAEVNVSIKGKSGTLGIGDWTTVNGYQVRILGFNHDALTDQTIYGGTNTYAGISFEYAEVTTTAKMNSSNTNANGWGACELRGILNSNIGLENREYIKQVNKQYIATYNDVNSVTTSNDKLWLLSCSEIWNNAATSGATYGWAIAKEGEQYKYYKNINATSSGNDTNLIKKNNGSAINWWLRSPNYDGPNCFCTVTSERNLLYEHCFRYSWCRMWFFYISTFQKVYRIYAILN